MSDRTPKEMGAEIKRRSDEYAHCYSFVGDDTMPRRKAELQAAISALTQRLEAAEALAEQYGRDAERRGIERDVARARLERTIQILMGIHGLIDPAPVAVGGKLMVFNNPHAAETLHALSARIRAIPDELDTIAKEQP